MTITGDPAKVIQKQGVVGPPAPPTQYALDVMAMVFGWFGREELVVTALRDGHNSGLHPRGYAVDIRTNDIPPAHVRAIHATGKKMLPGYDVMLESANTPGATGAHIHIEFDPEGNGGANLPDLKLEAAPTIS